MTQAQRGNLRWAFFVSTLEGFSQNFEFRRGQPPNFATICCLRFLSKPAGNGIHPGLEVQTFKRSFVSGEGQEDFLGGVFRCFHAMSGDVPGDWLPIPANEFG